VLKTYYLRGRRRRRHASRGAASLRKALGQADLGMRDELDGRAAVRILCLVASGGQHRVHGQTRGSLGVGLVR
jgi:hypothetical protein